ncbi:MAG TPA: Vms1/Ankzf1 family peptidyl-tRNA hydrolase [Gaiellaceae bacterium]|nr:Vms1/Ankzf1 family peptidyl-tRNA hydrolase [Gaiellaceae bacterium]
MTTLAWSDLRALAAFRAQSGCALSLYVDLGPEVAATPRDVQRRASAMLDEAAKLARSAGDDLDHEARLALRADLARAREFIEHDLDRDGSHGLALFAAPLDDLWRVLQLRGRVADAVHVSSQLYVTPLVSHVDDERAIVAHVGRELGEVYVLRDGRLAKVADRTSEQPRRHDQGGWSQANYQRHVDALARAHLRDVAEVLDDELHRLGGAAVVLAGTEEARAELEPLLAERVAGSVVGWTRVESHASASDLQPAAQEVLTEHRARRERLLLDRWLEDIGRGIRAAAGWADTCEAASDERVETLLYDAAANHDVSRCPTCTRLQIDEGTCPLDGFLLERRAEGLDLVVHKVLEHGGTVVAVSAHRDLDPVGGIGALLRF